MNKSIRQTAVKDDVDAIVDVRTPTRLDGLWIEGPHRYAADGTSAVLAKIAERVAPRP